MSWVEASFGHAPANSLVAGHDHDGEPIYVARAEYQGELIPGKLVSSHKGAFLPWGGREISTTFYHVLTRSTNQWVADRNGNVPPSSLIGGKASNNEVLFVGRVQYLNTITPGKVYPSHGVCYITFDGKELKFPEYEVLLAN